MFGGVYRYVIYFTPLLIYGSFSQSVGGLDWNREIFGLLKVGIFRCFAGLFMGAVIYNIKGIITCREICVFKRVIMTVIELLSYTLSILIAWIWSDVANAEFLIVLLLVIALTITLSNSSYTVILDRQIFSYLGMMSLPIYICHYSIGYLIGRYWYNLDNYVKYLMYFVIVFLFSIIMLLTDMKVLRGVKGEPHR